MNKNLFILFSLTLSLLSCGGQNKAESQQGAETETEALTKTQGEASGLKQLIDAAVMKTYTDGEYQVKVSYPDFFVMTTAEPGTARFNYADEQHHHISMVMFVEPNVEGWSVAEAVKQIADFDNICEKQGKDYYIMSGQLSADPRACFYEKCYLMNGNWVDYAVYYLAEDKEAVGRLIKTVKDWNPKH